MNTAKILWVWALQEYSAVAVGRCRDVLRLGAAGILGGWALQAYVAIEHCSQAPGGGRGQHRLYHLTTPLRGWRINLEP